MNPTTKIEFRIDITSMFLGTDPIIGVAGLSLVVPFSPMDASRMTLDILNAKLEGLLDKALEDLQQKTEAQAAKAVVAPVETVNVTAPAVSG